MQYTIEKVALTPVFIIFAQYQSLLQAHYNLDGGHK
jgi:hypothetical protein